MNPPSADYQFDRMIAQISPEVTATFTSAQLKALRTACGHLAWKKHRVDVRLSIPFPGRGYYLVFLAGRERRSRVRQLSESKYSYGVLISLITSGLLFTTTLVVVFTPVIRSALKSMTHSNAHPTAIPWIYSQDECLETKRVWRNDACWDQGHDPNF